MYKKLRDVLQVSPVSFDVLRLFSKWVVAGR